MRLITDRVLSWSDGVAVTYPDAFRGGLAQGISWDKIPRSRLGKEKWLRKLVFMLPNKSGKDGCAEKARHILIPDRKVDSKFCCHIWEVE